MASQTGFPDPTTIAPQVIVQEVDNSLVTTPTNPHSIAIVGFASKGPINQPTVVTSRANLYQTFGYPHPQDGDPHMIYAAEIVLQNVDSATMVRCADIDPASGESASTASVSVPSAGGEVEIISNTTGPYVFAVDSFFRWRLNGLLASKTLVVLAGTYSVTELVTALNAQLSAQDGIVFFTSDTSTIAVETTFSYGLAASIELVSIQDAIYGPGSVTGLGTLMTPAALTGTASKYPNNSYTAAGTYDFTGLTDLNLQIVIDGTDNVSIDGIVQIIDFSSLEGMSNTISDVVDEINLQITDAVIPGGFIASATSNNLTLTTLHSGEDARLLVKADSTADGIFGLSNTTVVGTSSSCVTGNPTYTCGIVTGNSNVSGDVTFVVMADSPGLEGNNTSVTIVNNTAGDGTFSISVSNGGNVLENWGNLTKNTASTFYVGTYLQEVSNYITVVDNTNVVALPLPGTYSLIGGSDGIPANPDDQDTLLIGSVAGVTGLQTLSDTDQIDVDLVAIPGHTSTSIATALIAFCEDRNDCLGIVDPPFGLSVTEIVQWQNGTHPLNTVRFDSDNAALFYPWCKYADVTNDVEVWIPPSGPVLSTFAFSDNVGAGPWMAAAGETRGVVTSITDVFTRPTSAERDSMYGNANAVNPIIDRNGTGFVIWGNKTLQRLNTSRNRINTVRMVFYAKKQIETNAAILLFEQLTPQLLTRFVQIATAILSNIQLQSGITKFFVQCDDTLNTPTTMSLHELNAVIGIQATPDAEYIFTTISLDSLGSF